MDKFSQILAAAGRKNLKNCVEKGSFMVKHIIIWKLREEIEDKESVKVIIKAGLEGLPGKIPGLLEMHIKTEGFDSSSGDIMMDSSFESVEALKDYQKNPLHLNVAEGAVRPNVSKRLSFDYEL